MKKLNSKILFPYCSINQKHISQSHFQLKVAFLEYRIPRKKEKFKVFPYIEQICTFFLVLVPEITRSFVNNFATE